MVGLICPKCGRSDSEVGFIDAFCIDDFPVKLKTPTGLSITRCKRCGKMMLQGEWQKLNLRKISTWVEGKCRGDFKKVIYDPETQLAEFAMNNGAMIKQTIPLEIITNMCPDCNRSSGGYYEAIIQLRGPDRNKIEKMADKFLKALAKTTFIAKEEEKDEGLDLYIGSSKAVVALVSELKLKTQISKKLVGRDEGKTLYRTTFLLRLDEEK